MRESGVINLGYAESYLSLFIMSCVLCTPVFTVSVMCGGWQFRRDIVDIRQDVPPIPYFHLHQSYHIFLPLILVAALPCVQY